MYRLSVVLLFVLAGCWAPVDSSSAPESDPETISQPINLPTLPPDSSLVDCGEVGVWAGVPGNYYRVLVPEACADHWFDTGDPPPEEVGIVPIVDPVQVQVHNSNQQ